MSTRIVVSFKINESGDATDIRLEQSSGMRLNDESAIKAIQNTKLDYVPLEHAKISFSFGYNLYSTVVQIPDEAPPPLVYVRSVHEWAPEDFRSDCSTHTDLNNQGILELLNGQRAHATDLFAQSAHSAPNYLPAIHNLAIARQANSK